MPYSVVTKSNETKSVRELVKQISSPDLLTTASFPFVLHLPARMPLWIMACLRYLPDKRATLLAHWADKFVVAKLFIAKKRAKQHYLRELHGLQALHRYGIATAPLLYAGAGIWPDTYIIITGFLFGAKTLSTCFRETAQPVRQVLAQSFIKNVIEMHRLGIIQKDLHGGNFLFWQGRWHTLDGDGISYNKLRSDKINSNNLALACYQMLHYFPAVPSDNLLDMLIQTKEDNSYEKIKIKVKRKLEKITWHQHKSFLKKTRRVCSSFGVISTESYKGYYQKDKLSLAEAQKLFDSTIDERSVDHSMTLQPSAPNSTQHKHLGKLAYVQYAHELSRHRLHWRNAAKRVLHLWQYHQLLLQHEIPVVPLLAAQVDSTEAGIHYLWQTTRHSQSLKQQLAELWQEPLKWQAILVQVIQIYLRLQQLRLSFQRFDSSHFAVDTHHRVFIARVDGVRLHRYNLGFNKATLSNWQDLLSDFHDNSEVVDFLQQTLIKEKGE